jgi:hypothetical protein
MEQYGEACAAIRSGARHNYRARSERLVVRAAWRSGCIAAGSGRARTRRRRRDSRAEQAAQTRNASRGVRRADHHAPRPARCVDECRIRPPACQRQQLGRTPMLMADPLGAFQQGCRRRTAIAAEWSVCLERHVEQDREESLRVAGGQSNVTDLRHARHHAIAWGRSEGERGERTFAFCSAGSKAGNCADDEVTRRSKCRKCGVIWRARRDSNAGPPA